RHPALRQARVPPHRPGEARLPVGSHRRVGLARDRRARAGDGSRAVMTAVKLASQLVPGEAFHLGPDTTDPVRIVERNTGKRLYLRGGGSFPYDETMTLILHNPDTKEN